MKKILYYLPNIILGIYLILYIPVQRMVIDYMHRTMEEWSGMFVNSVMEKLSLIIILIVFSLRFIFHSKKYEVTGLEKKINIILFVIETLLLIVIGMIFSLI